MPSSLKTMESAEEDAHQVQASQSLNQGKVGPGLTCQLRCGRRRFCFSFSGNGLHFWNGKGGKLRQPVLKGYRVGEVYGHLRKEMTEKTAGMKEAFNRGTDKLYHAITNNNIIVQFRIGVDGRLILENTVRSINLQTKRLGKARENLIRAGKEVPVKAQKHMRQAITGDPNKRIRDHMTEAPQVKMMDKASFTIGVAIICFAEYLILRHPQYFTLFYTILMLGLFLIRFFMYKKTKFHFFMLDFCYVVNLSSMMQANYFMDNEIWFKANFALSMGPICLAIIVWHNSLVFHSVEKLTSFFLHAFPPMLNHLFRWQLTTPESLKINQTVSWEEIYGPSLALYMAWQMFYLVMTEVVCRETLEEDPDIITSLRYLARDRRNPLHKFVTSTCRQMRILNKDEELNSENLKTKMIYLITQLIYTLFCLIPSYFLYHNYIASSLYIVFTFLVGTWNGASYYIEVFSKRYNLKFDKANATQQAKATEKGVERKDSGSQTPYLGSGGSNSPLEHDTDDGNSLCSEPLEEIKLNESQAMELIKMLEEVEVGKE